MDLFREIRSFETFRLSSSACLSNEGEGLGVAVESERCVRVCRPPLPIDKFVPLNNRGSLKCKRGLISELTTRALSLELLVIVCGDQKL